VPKTLHLLSWLDDPTYPQDVGAQLNLRESRHRLVRKTCHGQRGELRRSYREGQEDQLSALGLVLNAMVLRNTRYIDAAVDRLRSLGEPVVQADVARLSPLGDGYLNMFGRYSFNKLADEASFVPSGNQASLTTTNPRRLRKLLLADREHHVLSVQSCTIATHTPDLLTPLTPDRARAINPVTWSKEMTVPIVMCGTEQTATIKVPLAGHRAVDGSHPSLPSWRARRVEAFPLYRGPLDLLKAEKRAWHRPAP